MSKETPVFGVAIVAVIILLGGAGYFFYLQEMNARHLEYSMMELDAIRQQQHHLEKQLLDAQNNRKKVEAISPQNEKTKALIKQITADQIDAERRLKYINEQVEFIQNNIQAMEDERLF